jgi:hypothetical protein
MAEEKTGYSANPDYESVTTDSVRTKSRLPDAVIWDDNGTYRAESQTSEISNNTDLGALLNTVIGNLGHDIRIEVAPGTYDISTTVIVDRRIELIAAGPQQGRWNGDNAATRFIWKGGSSPVFEVGGTSSNPVHETHLEGFLLKPDTAGDGTDGVLIDGSTTRNANRTSVQAPSMKDVHIRDFGTHQLHVLGNVFDYHFDTCAFHADSGVLVNHEEATSSGVDSPNYGEYYSCAFHSGSSGTTSIGGQFRGNIIGGHSTTDSGFEMGFRSSIVGTHIESASSGPDTFGIKVQSGPCRIAPQSITGVTDGVVINEAQASINLIIWGDINGSSNSLNVESGSVKILEAKLDDGISQSVSAGNVRDLRDIGYDHVRESFWLEESTLPLAFGTFEHFLMDYDGASDEWVWKIADSGGVQDERLRATKGDTSTWDWTQVHHQFQRVSIRDTNRQSLSGNLSLSDSDAQIQNIDPGGSARTITLPVEDNGIEFIIGNRGSSDLTVEDDGNNTIATVNAGDVGRFISDGTGWLGFSAAGGVD